MLEHRYFAFVVAKTGGVRETLRRCQRHGRVSEAPSVTAGQALLASRRHVGIVLGTALDGDSPLDLLALAREHNPFAPILVLMREGEAVTGGLLQKYQAVRRTHAASAAELEAFFLDAALIGATDDARLHAAKRDLVVRHELDVRETEVLTLAVDQVPREHWEKLLPVGSSSFRRTVTSLLRKTQAGNLKELVVRVREAEVASRRATPPSAFVPPPPMNASLPPAQAPPPPASVPPPRCRTSRAS